jgi:hypothetical protein
MGAGHRFPARSHCRIDGADEVVESDVEGKAVECLRQACGRKAADHLTLVLAKSAV